MTARHPYTAEQIELVRSLYATHTAAELAAKIFGPARAAQAIHRLARQLGLRKWPSHAPALIARIRRLHARGLNDVEIAAKLGSTRNTVHAVRYERLHLPPNGASILEAKRQAVRTQRARLGLRSAGELRTWAFRNYARRHGWPADLRPREVQVLNVLAARGPMTSLEIAEAIGMATGPFASGARRILLAGNGRGGTYTATLMRRGLIVRLGRRYEGRRYRVVYSISLTAERKIEP